jgi:hypothetical protein
MKVPYPHSPKIARLDFPQLYAYFQNCSRLNIISSPTIPTKVKTMQTYFKAATARAISPDCTHVHADVITASVCAWRLHLDHIVTVNYETDKATAKPKARLERAEWRAMRAAKSAKSAKAAAKPAAKKPAAKKAAAKKPAQIAA